MTAEIEDDTRLASVQSIVGSSFRAPVPVNPILGEVQVWKPVAPFAEFGWDAPLCPPRIGLS